MRNLNIFIGIVILVMVIGFTNRQSDRAWAGKRVSDVNVNAYSPPEKPADTDPDHEDLEEPTGIITLREALSLALMGNPELAAYSLEIRAREADALQAGLIPNPEIEFELENFGGGEENTGFSNVETTILLSQLIELGGKRSKRAHVAQLEMDLSTWDYESTKLDVLTEATIAFMAAVAAQEREKLAEETMSLSETMYNTVSERVKAGKVSPLEEIKASVTVSTGRIRLEKSRRTLQIARETLSASWGSLSPRFESVSGDLYAIDSLPSIEYLESLIGKSPEIARWKTVLEQNRVNVELEKANRYPDLTVGGGFRWFEEIDDHAFVFGFSLPVPLFDRNQGGIQAAGSRMMKADSERTAHEVQLRLALEEAFEAVSSLHAEIIVLRDNLLPSAEQVYGATGEGYRQGKFGFLEVLDAQRTLYEAKEQYVEALADYHTWKARMDRLIGYNMNITDMTGNDHTGGNKNDI